MKDFIKELSEITHRELLITEYINNITELLDNALNKEYIEDNNIDTRRLHLYLNYYMESINNTCTYHITSTTT